MTIFERQYTKVLAEELLKALLEGKVPNTNEIADRISKALSKDGNVTYQYISQPSKSVFQIDRYNSALKQIKFDIDTFQEELLDLFSQSTKRISYADLYHKVNSYELDNLQSKLEAILFSIENADYYFLSAFDNFSDTSKMDVDQSTPSIINLSETALQLPYGGRSTQRISTSHLAPYDTWNINILTPESSKIIAHSMVSGTKFSNMFIDTTSAWAYQISTREKVPVSIRFVVPIAGAAEQDIEVLVNRLELVSHSLGKQNIKIRLSTDNVNFVYPLGYEEGIDAFDSKKLYAIDFETNLVQYVEVTISKDGPDQTITRDGQVSYQYVFGLRGVAAYYNGRISTATYISKPFSFAEKKDITKVSIRSDYQKPQGTNIKYFIALSDDEGVLKTDYLPINPVGKKLQASAPEIITLDSNNKKSVRFSVDTSKTAEDLKYGTPFRGKSLYKIKEDIEPTPIFGSVELTRGYNAWARDTSLGYLDLTVPSCYVNFGNIDNESIYAISTESVSFTKEVRAISPEPTAPLPNAGNSFFDVEFSSALRIKLSKNPYFDTYKGHALRPTFSIQPTNDLAPTYAIYKVEHVQTSTRRSIRVSLPILYPNGSFTSQIPFQLGVSNFLINSSNPSLNPTLTAIEVGASGAPLQLTPLADYLIATKMVDGIHVPTGIIQIPFQSLLRIGAPYVEINKRYILEFSYTPVTDITHKIESLENGNELVVLDALVPDSDSVVVTYRHLVTSPNVIVRSTIEVYDLPTLNPNKILYKEGIDYTIDSTTGIIQRIQTGSIPQSGGVYVKFAYRSAMVGLEKFTTWCRVDDPAGVEARFELDPLLRKNVLVADQEKGEGVYINGPFGLVELTKAVGTPLLPPGWVQFIVVSKNPEANLVYKTNLIDQVIQLRDISGRKIFREGNVYFSTILAYRELLEQRTVNHLRVNTLTTDYQSFAIDDISEDNSILLVNFLANNTNDLYNFTPTSDFDVTNKPQEVPETYSLSWFYVNTDVAESATNLVVRIDLERDSNSDGFASPKIFDYQVRVGF